MSIESTPSGPERNRSLVPLLALSTGLSAASLTLISPSLPAIERDLGLADGVIGQMQALYLLGLALPQLIFGMVSDRIGRRPLLSGLLCFLLGYKVHTSFLRSVMSSASFLENGGDHGFELGCVRGSAAGKRGADLLARLVSHGARGVRVRRLGGSRAGEIRFTRFLRNPAVTLEEMTAAAFERTQAASAGRDVLAVQDTTVTQSSGGGGRFLHAI
ncbi:MFS transporter [Paracoccus sp. (in: a-proteobacteria)]|uniref:MFS transporter n=1 Tax=Paracoccus sp. TaxID=267 RepID=UPI003A8780AE